MINHYIKRHEEFLQKILNDLFIPAPTIRSAITYSLFPGGKRIRPILVYLTGNLLDIEPNVLDVIAAAIELTHCYSLIHDDLPAMDNDDLRRGKPSCHKHFDEATAILAGDGMQSLAIQILLTHLAPLLPPLQIIAISLELVKASGVSGMVSGQSLDLAELAKRSTGEKHLRDIHHFKTGRLISACIEMVLSAHSVSKKHQENLRNYAYHIGLVFQMQDDYLDKYAPPELLGKSRSSDTANHKTTFATLHSKAHLEKEILKQYQIAYEALTAFDQKALALIDLTKALQERSNLTRVPHDF